MSIDIKTQTAKLNSIIEFVEKNSKKEYLQRFPHLHSDDFISRLGTLFNLIIDWQNGLYFYRNDPSKFIIKNSSEYYNFKNSQRLLNKIKRKYNKLFLGCITSEEKECLVIRYLSRMGLPRNPKNREDAIYVLEHFGYDENCLKLFCEMRSVHLDSHTAPDDKLLDLSHCNHKNDPGILLTRTVKAVAAEAIISPNAWGYRGQPKIPLTEFSRETRAASDGLLNIVRKDIEHQILHITNQSHWSRLLKISKFNQHIIWGKLLDGSFIQQCGERTSRIFYRLARERKFNCVAYISICEKPQNPQLKTSQQKNSQLNGDIKRNNHAVIIAGPPNSTHYYVGDTWNGPIIYPTEKLYNCLQDCQGLAPDGKAILVDFDPQTQALNIEAFCIYPSSDFEQLSTTKDPQLFSLLRQFHQLPDREDKMLKALEIIDHIEYKMPLYEIYDKAIHELYDQMIFLTKKERKLTLAFAPDHCLINEALHTLNKEGLKQLIAEGNEMDTFTILHAIKAALRTDDIEFYMLVANAKPPIQSTSLTEKVFPHLNPSLAIEHIKADLFPVQLFPETLTQTQVQAMVE